jgi:hypothetical protein
MLNYIASQVIPDQVSVPIIGSEQPLHSIRAGVSSLLGQLPAVLALNGTEQPLQVIQNSSTWFGPTKTRRNAGMLLLTLGKKLGSGPTGVGDVQDYLVGAGPLHLEVTRPAGGHSLVQSLPGIKLLALDLL